MRMRRGFTGTAVALAAAAAIGTWAALRPARADGPAPASAKRLTLTWEEALAKMNAGNAHFVHDEPVPADVSQARRAEIAPKQHPYAIVLTCADSRVAPEHVFGAGLGDLFVVRVAGNVVDPVVLGSIEYAVEHLAVHLIVVLGHSSCGAVKAKIEPPEHAPAALAELLDHVHVGSAARAADLPAGILANTTWQAESLFESPVIEKAAKLALTKADADDTVTVHVVSGVYDLATGEAKLTPVTAPVESHAHSGK